MTSGAPQPSAALAGEDAGHDGQGDVRHVIGHFASGVTVITTRSGDEDFGATASAVSSLSLDPPMLLCLNTRSSTQQAIMPARAVVRVQPGGEGPQRIAVAGPDGDRALPGRAVRIAFEDAA